MVGEMEVVCFHYDSSQARQTLRRVTSKGCQQKRLASKDNLCHVSDHLGDSDFSVWNTALLNVHL